MDDNQTEETKAAATEQTEPTTDATPDGTASDPAGSTDQPSADPTPEPDPATHIVDFLRERGYDTVFTELLGYEQEHPFAPITRPVPSSTDPDYEAGRREWRENRGDEFSGHHVGFTGADHYRPGFDPGYEWIPVRRYPAPWLTGSRIDDQMFALNALRAIQARRTQDALLAVAIQNLVQDLLQEPTKYWRGYMLEVFKNIDITILATIHRGADGTTTTRATIHLSARPDPRPAALQELLAEIEQRRRRDALIRSLSFGRPTVSGGLFGKDRFRKNIHNTLLGRLRRGLETETAPAAEGSTGTPHSAEASSAKLRDFLRGTARARAELANTEVELLTRLFGDDTPTTDQANPTTDDQPDSDPKPNPEPKAD